MITTTSRRRRLGAALLLIGSIACGDVLVTTTADENNGSLDPGLGAGTSLREAVLHAPDGSVIGFAAPLDGQTFTIALGQITIGKNLSINASPLAAGVTVSANHASRVFNVSTSKTVTLTALDLVNGDVSGDGGAILNAGNLTLVDCELSGNAAGDGGGAIENSGTLTLSACTLADNTAAVGGGAIEHASGTLTATNCTFSGNTAEFGGAIDGDGSSTIRLYSCTVSGNHATNDGGGIEETTGTLLLENTIVAGNTAVDQGPDLKASSINTQAGVNLVSSIAGLGGSFGGIVASPNLAALADNGGRTRTMPPLSGSPAIDAGGSTTLAVDQRGLARVAGTAVDIGAVEVQATVVTTNANAGPGSLRDAVAAAPAGETVTFAPALDGQTVALTSPVVIPREVVIDGSDRVNLAISGGDLCGIFTVETGVTATLRGLALRDGSRSSGGAIHNSGTLALHDCIIRESHSGISGGGIFNAPGALLEVTDCEIVKNQAEVAGGGVFNGGTAIFTRSSLVDNGAGSEDGGSGGGISSTGSLSLFDSVVRSNGAFDGGGGIVSSGTVVMERCTVEDNETSVDGDGGGLIVWGAGGTITACTFAGNHCQYGGGGIFHWSGTLVLVNTTLAGNVSDFEFGGGLYTRASTALNSCTLSANEAGQEGGGVYVDTPGQLSLLNSVVAGNQAFISGADLRGAIETQAGVNLVASTDGIEGGFTGLVAPPQLGPLSDNGGPTLTMLPEPGSPVIDAGGSTTLTVDQRGLPRSVGAAVDIGAVEVQGGPVADTWETLASPPFPHGVSCGGGLTTDGSYVYAADLSGDGDGDFIDLDDDGIKDPGESLAELGIANASVRFARFDPATGNWQSLPPLVPGGFSGDSWSRGNFNGGLFQAAGILYYYQFRAGPNRCVLHRYSLATAPGGSWQQVWDKDSATALLEPSAGMTAIDTAGGPVILHHRGAGSRDFCRTSSLGSGGQHVVLTPSWPNDGSNFPRNCGWEYDLHSGRLYHLTGNQLLAWSPSATYPEASFLTTTPVAGNPLATYHTPVLSLKTQLGWNPGGGTAPGASLWGNSVTILNAPTSVETGPAGEDTGANVLYLVRGETTADSWPFNEGRGQVTNGDFARYFPATGQVQTLEDAPFLIGKGSDSVTLNGFLYLTQGETRNSVDGPGNDLPINADGIRRPGSGFARFRLRASDYTTGEPVIPMQEYLAAKFAAVVASPPESGEIADLFDGDQESGLTTDSVNPAIVDIAFNDATPIGAVRGVFGPDNHQWTLEAANSTADLAAASGSFIRIFGPAATTGDGPHWQQWNESPVSRRIFRFTIQNMAGSSVEIRELELQRPKVVKTAEIGGIPVAVNHLQVLPESPVLVAGEILNMTAELSLSLGPDRYDVTGDAFWSASDPAVATVDSTGHLRALASGETTVVASFDGFIARTVVSVEAPLDCEPVTLSVLEVSPSGIRLRSTPLVYSSYQLQSSSDLVHWRNEGVVFGPLQEEHLIARPEDSRQFYRLACDLSLDLALAASQATTLTLNWPPKPGAVLYKVFRDGSDVGSTVGRFGFFTDTGLTPATTHEYRVEAFDSSNQSLGSSALRSFTTGSSSRMRTRYRQLGIGFYPGGPDADFPHVRTFFRHRIDFLRMASANTAILEPYGGDVIPILATPPVLSGTNWVDYVALVETPYPELGGRSIVDLVETGEVDVVNVVAFAGIDFAENAFVGNKGRNVGGSGEQWPPYPARCSRSFFVNANLADSRAFDAYAHCIEGIMSTGCDGHPAAWPRSDTYQIYTKDINDFTTLVPRNLHLFERFRLADQWNGLGPEAHASPGNGNCGSSHFPPNTRRDTDAGYQGDYAYFDRKTWQRYIDCASDDWLAFPALTGATRKFNGYDYGAFNRYAEGDLAYGTAFGVSPELHPSFSTDAGSFHQWWFFHLPHNSGVSSGRLHNWWPYIFDLNVFDGSAVSYPVTGGPEIPSSFPPVAGEYGTEQAGTEWWGYWCSFTDFGPFGQVAAVTRAEDPDFVKQGDYSLHVLVDQESFHYHGRNDLRYPITRNARWNLGTLGEVGVSLKLGLNPVFVAGANPVIRLCTNGGNRIEFAPLKNGRYANHFLDPAFQSGGGWSTFNIPVAGNANWEVNVIGYIDPALDPAQQAAARQQLKQDILSEVNYVEVSVRSTGGRGQQVSFYLDGLEFR